LPGGASATWCPRRWPTTSTSTGCTRRSSATLTALAKTQRGARAALDKKALGLQVLDVGALSGITDYFLLCSGHSAVHVRTIADAVEAALKSEGHLPRHREGLPESGWLLLDYGDLVVHVFLPETRDFYGLARLWGDAPELPIEA
jgi:ribosome-associated protein